MATTVGEQVAKNTKRLTTTDFGRKTIVVRQCGAELTAKASAGSAVAYLTTDPEMSYISQLRFKLIIGNPLAPREEQPLFNPTGDWDLSPNHQKGKYVSVQEFYDIHIFMGVDMDNSYGYQCWDLADDFWVNQVGRMLQTNGGDNNYSHGVQNSWLVTGEYNSRGGEDFAPITNWADIQPGDWIFWQSPDKIGHVAMALRKATNSTSGVLCLSQNYRNPSATRGSVASQDVLYPTMGSLTFLGAFRWRGDWNTTAPTVKADQREQLS